MFKKEEEKHYFCEWNEQNKIISSLTHKTLKIYSAYSVSMQNEFDLSHHIFDKKKSLHLIYYLRSDAISPFCQFNKK